MENSMTNKKPAWREGQIVQKEGNVMYEVKSPEEKSVKRHSEQIYPRSSLNSYPTCPSGEADSLDREFDDEDVSENTSTWQVDENISKCGDTLEGTKFFKSTDVKSGDFKRLFKVVATAVTNMNAQNTCLKDRKVAGRLIRRCAPGTELVDWMLSLSSNIQTRAQAAGMWQCLLEEGVISHLSKEQPFKDKCFLYRFWQDEEGATTLPPLDDIATAEEQLQESLSILIGRGPDAFLRMILRKPTHERTTDDLETIFEELLHIRAVAHLSNSVKKELASVVVFEAHPKAGTVYIINMEIPPQMTVQSNSQVFRSANFISVEQLPLEMLKNV